MRQYKFVALFVFVLFLPVSLIGIANAAKPIKPEYALQSDLEVVADDVATLLIGQRPGAARPSISPIIGDGHESD